MKNRTLRQLHSVVVDFGGEPHSGWFPPDAVKPLDTPIRTVLIDFEIVEDDGGYTFQWSPSPGQTLSLQPYEGDTWHESLEDALLQAQESFGISPGDWLQP